MADHRTDEERAGSLPTGCYSPLHQDKLTDELGGVKHNREPPVKIRRGQSYRGDCGDLSSREGRGRGIVKRVVPNFVNREHIRGGMDRDRAALMEEELQPKHSFFEIPDEPGLCIIREQKAVSRYPKVVVI